jgi:hypothetical protein
MANHPVTQLSMWDAMEQRRMPSLTLMQLLGSLTQWAA